MGAHVTAQDGVNDFNSHDAAGFFKYVDRMEVTPQNYIWRYPYDVANPGPLYLKDTTVWPIEYANGYVNAFNAKYKKQNVIESYQPLNATINNSISGVNAPLPPISEPIGKMIKISGFDFGNSSAADSTRIAKPNVPISNNLSAGDYFQDPSKKWYWIGGGILVLILVYLFIRKKRRK